MALVTLNHVCIIVRKWNLDVYKYVSLLMKERFCVDSNVLCKLFHVYCEIGLSNWIWRSRHFGNHTIVVVYFAHFKSPILCIEYPEAMLCHVFITLVFKSSKC